jgi:hypothetical protein
MVTARKPLEANSSRMVHHLSLGNAGHRLDYRMLEQNDCPVAQSKGFPAKRPISAVSDAFMQHLFRAAALTRAGALNMKTAKSAGWRRRVLPRRVQIALKPASKTPGLHGVFIRGKGLQDVIADSASKRVQVHARACRLDADEHHRGLAPRTSGAPNCNEWNDGRQALRLGHDASPRIGGSATLSVTGKA